MTRAERIARAYWLRQQQRRAEVAVAAAGGFIGRVRRAQRALSHLLDRLEHERQRLRGEAA